MKQQRDLQNEANKDKQDWQRYQAENVSLPENFQNIDQVTNLIRILMQSVQHRGMPTAPMGRSHSQGPMHHNNYGNQGGYPQGGNRGYNNQGGNRPNYQGNNNQRGPAPGAPMPQPMRGMPMPHAGGMPMPACC